MKHFLDIVDDGIQGKNTGFKTGFDKLDTLTGNLQKSCYYTIGASSKVGKTAWVDEYFVLGPYCQSNYNPKIKWVYYSFEVAKIEKIAKWIAWFLQRDHGITVDSKYILSRGDDKLSAEHKTLVEIIYNTHIEKLFGKHDKQGKVIEKGLIDFIDIGTNPTGIFKEVVTVAEDFGTIHHATQYTISIYKGKNLVKEVRVDDPEKLQSVKDKIAEKQGYAIKVTESEKISGYTPNDDEHLMIPIVDHSLLIPLERGFTKKENIEKLSQYFVFLRNIFGMSPVLISQFNRGITNVERQKLLGDQLGPQVEDWSDTGSIIQDVTIAIALFKPSDYKHLKNYKGFNITAKTGLGKHFRTLHLLASRNTSSGAVIGMNMIGKTGTFQELPKPEEMNETTYQFYRNMNL